MLSHALERAHAELEVRRATRTSLVMEVGADADSDDRASRRFAVVRGGYGGIGMRNSRSVSLEMAWRSWSRTPDGRRPQRMS